MKTNISSLNKQKHTACCTSSYKPLWLQRWIWCGLLTSNTGRRHLLACNQTYLSLWHPGGTSLMRQDEKMFLRKTERREMDPKERTSTIVVTSLWPVWHSASSANPVRDLDAWPLSSTLQMSLCSLALCYRFQVNLELEFKLVTPAKARGSGSTNRGLIWCCHPAGLP